MQLERHREPDHRARNRYIKTVAEYNVLARSFPTNLTAMLFSYTPKPSFTVANEAADLDAARRELRQAGVEVGAPVRRRQGRLSDAALADRAAAGRAGAARRRPRPGRAAGAALSGRVIDQTGTLSRARPRRWKPSSPPSRASRGAQIVVLMVPEHAAGGHRRLRPARRRHLEDRPPQRRRRRARRRGQERPAGAHRGRQGARRRDPRPGREPHHRRGHHAGVQGRGLCRRVARRRWSGWTRGSATRACPSLSGGPACALRIRLARPGDLPVHRGAGGGSLPNECWGASWALLPIHRGCRVKGFPVDGRPAHRRHAGNDLRRAGDAVQQVGDGWASRRWSLAAGRHGVSAAGWRGRGGWVGILVGRRRSISAAVARRGRWPGRFGEAACCLRHRQPVQTTPSRPAARRGAAPGAARVASEEAITAARSARLYQRSRTALSVGALWWHPAAPARTGAVRRTVGFSATSGTNGA